MQITTYMYSDFKKIVQTVSGVTGVFASNNQVWAVADELAIVFGSHVDIGTVQADFPGAVEITDNVAFS